MLYSCRQAMDAFNCIRPSQRSIMRLLYGLPANFNIAQDGIYPILTKEDWLVAVLERRDGKNDYLRLTTPEELMQARRQRAIRNSENENPPSENH